MVETQEAPLIMVLDDDIEFRDLVAQTLNERGYDIMRVSRPNQAMELLEKAPVDLMIIDGLLPEMNGYEFIAQARSKGFETPTIFVTAFSAFHRDIKTYQNLTRDLKVAQVLSKPITMQELVLQIDTLFGSKAPPVDLEDELQATLIGPAPSSFDPDIGQSTLEDYPLWENLSRRYIGKLDQRLMELLQAISKARQYPEDNEFLQKAHHIAHKIHGTAGSYGFMKVSQIVGYIETLLSELLSGTLTHHPDVWNDIESSLERAIEQVQARQRQFDLKEDSSHSSLARLLVIDEDTNFIQEFTRIAQSHQFHVHPITSPQELVPLAQEDPFDTVFLDLHFNPTPFDEGTNPPDESNLSIVSGVQFAQRLRRLDGFEQIPIIFLTQNPTLHHRMSAVYAGGTAFLSKSFSEHGSELLDLMEQILEEKRQRQHKILVVDDDQEFIQWLGNILQERELQVQMLSTPSRILDALEDYQPDLLLLDFSMPGFNGIDLTKMLRSMPRWKGLPILLLTARTDPELRATALRSGLDDYINKPILIEELMSRIQLHLGRIKTLERQRYRDSLTGLLTRHAFLDLMSSRLEEAQRFDHSVALCFMDIDQLKQINETYGYSTGDQILSQIGQILTRDLRLYDACCHWQEDQFGLLFFESRTRPIACRSSRGSLDKICAYQFSSKGGIAFQIKMTASLSMYPNPSNSLEALLHNTAHKLTKAQKAGGNQLIV